MEPYLQLMAFKIFLAIILTGIALHVIIKINYKMDYVWSYVWNEIANEYVEELINKGYKKEEITEKDIKAYVEKNIKKSFNSRADVIENRFKRELSVSKNTYYVTMFIILVL